MSAKSALDQAIRAARSGDLAGAAGAARQAVELDPKMERAYLLWGSACEQQGDLQCSMDAYQRGLEALPRSAELLRERGLLRLQQGDASGAVSDLERALDTVEAPETRADLAFAYLFAGQPERAQQASLESVQAAPECFLCWMARAEVLTQLERHREAEAAYAEALRITPNDPDALAGRAKARFRAGDAAGSSEIFERLVQRIPDDPRLRVQAAQAAMAAEFPGRAVRHLERVVRDNPDNVELLEFLLRAREAAGDADGARRARERLKALQ